MGRQAKMHAQPDAGPLTLTASFQIEAAAQDAESGSAPALPRFSMTAYTGGPMKIFGWRHPVIVDLAGLAIPRQNRPIRFGHDASTGVGHTDAIRVEAGQLIATGVVSRDTTAAREVVASSKNGFPWQASIGASVEEFEFIKENQKTNVNGRAFTGPVNVVRKATLGEISFVDLGADDNTSAQIAASTVQGKESPHMETTVNTNTQADAPASTERTPEQVRAEAIAETARIAAIRNLCAPTSPGGRHFGDIEAKAIAENWDATKTELEVLRASRPQAKAAQSAPMGFVIPSAGDASQEVLKAACLLSAGIDKPETHCDEKHLDAAAKRYRHGIGLQGLILEAAIANGYHGHSFRSDPHAIMRMAFPARDQIQAGFSVVDIGGILSNTANKFLLEGFLAVERTWRNICSVRSVPDFKTVTSYRLTGTDQYEQVTPGGELKHGTLGNDTYTNKANTYGLMLTINRQDIINDDLGAITTVPRKLGRGSGLKINDVFWTAFMSNSSFFATGNKNFLDGTTSAMGIDGLTGAEKAFMDLTDTDGKPTGVTPAIMLVPTALSALGTQIFKSIEIRDTNSSLKYPVANPHAGKFRVEVSRYLGNSSYTGNSQKAWYLLSDPADLSVIEVAFLNGNEAPTIESAEADFNTLGVQMRGYHDFGVALQDPRAGVKSKGEA